MAANGSERSDDRAERLDAWLALTGQTPMPAGRLRLPLLSGSMLPAVPPGSLLVIEPGRRAGLGRGDVVVYAEGMRLVAHRVLLRLRLPGLDVIFEKGDANPRGRWLASRRVAGRVCEVIPPAAPAFDPGDPRAAARSFWHLMRHGWRAQPLAGADDEGDARER